MSVTPTESDARQIREILVGFLEAASIARWPGGDGLTMEDVLDTFPEAVARGEAPDWEELLRRHPELADALHAWLAAKDRWQFAYRRDPKATTRRGGEIPRGDG